MNLYLWSTNNFTSELYSYRSQTSTVKLNNAKPHRNNDSMIKQSERYNYYFLTVILLLYYSSYSNTYE